MTHSPLWGPAHACGAPQLSTAAAASGLQTLLDAECLKLHAKSCMEGQQQFCQPAVSRFKSNGPSGKSFSCYKTNELNYATTDNSCVDNCGNPVACAGAVGYASVYGEEQTKLRQVVETMTDAMCNISVGVLIARIRRSRFHEATFMQTCVYL